MKKLLNTLAEIILSFTGPLAEIYKKSNIVPHDSFCFFFK